MTRSDEEETIADCVWVQVRSKQAALSPRTKAFVCMCSTPFNFTRPRCKNQLWRNITTHNTLARLMNSLQSVQIGWLKQIKAAVLQCKYCEAEWIQSHYFHCLDWKTQSNNSGVKFYSWLLLCCLRGLSHTTHKCMLNVKMKIKMHCI